ncbi:hypothetical protein [uncultured Vagococcus sp.]|nr:hypothetical protein [uncultured Vagococcus sp.]
MSIQESLDIYLNESEQKKYGEIFTIFSSSRWVILSMFWFN